MIEVIDGRPYKKDIIGDTVILIAENEQYITLETSKNTILADSVDKVLINAKLYSYDGKLIDFPAQTITIELEGEKIVLPSNNAVVEVTSETVGKIVLYAYSDKAGRVGVQIESK